MVMTRMYSSTGRATPAACVGMQLHGGAPRAGDTGGLAVLQTDCTYTCHN